MKKENIESLSGQTLFVGIFNQGQSMCFSVEVDKDIKKLAARFHASIDCHAFDQFSSMQKTETERDAACVKESLGLKRKPTSPFFKEAGNNSLIYLRYFVPVIVWGNGMRQILPIRYRVRPHGLAAEIPARFNVFNARLDSLETRRTWKVLFMGNIPCFHFSAFLSGSAMRMERKGWLPSPRMAVTVCGLPPFMTTGYQKTTK